MVDRSKKIESDLIGNSTAARHRHDILPKHRAQDFEQGDHFRRAARRIEYVHAHPLAESHGMEQFEVRKCDPGKVLPAAATVGSSD
jgi:hypothetical protein